MGWMTGVQFPAGAMMGFFSLHHCIYTGSEAHPAYYLMGTRDSFPRSKVARYEADRSPPFSAKVKNVWSCTSIPLVPWTLVTQWIHLHGALFS